MESPYNFKDMIHIIVMTNDDAFGLLSKEHDEMELYINSNPILRKVAFALKRNGMNGTFIYRSFLSCMKEDNPQ